MPQEDEGAQGDCEQDSVAIELLGTFSATQVGRFSLSLSLVAALKLFCVSQNALSRVRSLVQLALSPPSPPQSGRSSGGRPRNPLQV